MRVKEVQPSNFLLFRAATTVGQLVNYLPVAQRLYEEAVKHNLRINGPVHWHYQGFFGDPEAPFTLEVCLPVQQIPDAYDGAYHVKRTEPFKCVSLVHEGSWESIPESYGHIMQWIGKNKLAPKGTNRELYIHVDLDLPGANVTEIQFGIQ
jgi:effector-binding domain-containing protein